MIRLIDVTHAACHPRLNSGDRNAVAISHYPRAVIPTEPYIRLQVRNEFTSWTEAVIHD